MRTQIGQFRAKAADGRVFTITEYQNVIDAGTLEDPHGTDLGMKELFTLDDEKVMDRGDGIYDISGLIVHRIP